MSRTSQPGGKVQEEGEEITGDILSRLGEWLLRLRRGCDAETVERSWDEIYSLLDRSVSRPSTHVVAVSLLSELDRIARPREYWPRWLQLLIRLLMVFRSARRPHSSVALWMMLGSYFKRLGDLSRARAAYNKAFLRAKLLGVAGRKLALTASVGLADAYRDAGDLRAALQYASGAISLARRGSLGELAMAYHLESRIYGDMRQWKEAFQYAQQSLILWAKAGDREGLVRLYHSLSLILFQMGRLPRALQLARKAEEMCLDLNANYSLAWLDVLSGSLYGAMGDLVEAMRHFDRAVEAFEGFNNGRARAIALQNKGMVLLSAGEYGDAEQCFGHALAAWVETGSPFGQATALHALGVVRAKLGHRDEACIYMQRALSQAAQIQPDPLRDRVIGEINADLEDLCGG